MTWSWIPNLLTGLRLLLVAPIVLLLLDGRHAPALALFALAGLSDGLDGWLARRYGWQSRLGGYLDPLADKALMVGTFAALAWTGKIPVWLFWVVLGRDLVIVSGALAYHRLIGRLEAEPSILGKFTTLLQIVLVFAVLVDLGSPLQLGVAVPLLVIGVTLACFASGMHYVAAWGGRALRARNDLAPR